MIIIYLAVRIQISVAKLPTNLAVTWLTELPPMGGYPVDGHPNLNRKYMSGVPVKLTLGCLMSRVILNVVLAQFINEFH
jgi:hypothetical protein